jgi:hypothetical protein
MHHLFADRIKMMTVLENAQWCSWPRRAGWGKLRTRPGAGMNTMRHLDGWDVLTGPPSSDWILRGTRVLLLNVNWFAERGKGRVSTC